MPARRRREFVAIRTRCTLGVRTSYGQNFFGYDVSSGVDCRIGAYGFIDQQTMATAVVIGDYRTYRRAVCWPAT
ncbi:hypothetical protein P4123_30735 [Pseudomonas aeruginosa]|nr:hypothetical protein [Pseudomonas aeruginosa]